MYNNPFLYSDTNKRYHTYDYFLRRRYGNKCFKVPLDGGFTCPNIDGTRGIGGCTYCTLPLHPSPLRGISLKEQFQRQISILSKKWPNACYIAYFQDYTNTYAPVEKLRCLFEEALSFDGVKGLSVATRADCISDSVLDYLQALAKNTHLTVELGLQTIHEKTAQKINRCHSFDEFENTFRRLEGIERCVHIIDGLPGETHEMMMQTALKLSHLHPEIIKIHMLYISEGTPLARSYEKSEFEMLSLSEFTDIVYNQLLIIPQDICIARVTGDGNADTLIAPEWSKKKFVVMNELDKRFAREGTYQGFLCN